MNRRDLSKKACLLAPILALALALTPALPATVNDAAKLFADGKLTEALAQLAEILQQDPGNLAAHFWVGRCKFETGDLAGAADEFQTVLTAKPSSTESRYWLGVVRQHQGQLEQARALFQQVLRESPRHAQARASLAEIEEALGSRPLEISHDWVLTTPASRISLEVQGLQVPAGEVQIFSSHVRDYTFADPPVDWVPSGGLWELTNRWTCSPQWSWYGGYEANGVAAIWNKRQFEGDITVEVYAAFKMGVALGEGRSYRNPNDMNITICGDGANLDSGYSFIYGGDLNSRSRIVRGTKTLYETRKPEALLPIFEDGFPSTYEFHRKWWSLRVRKTDDLLQFYVDEKLIGETRDPQPLDGGRVAIWARDNGLIISRVKIYYEREVYPRDPTPTDHLRTPAIASVAEPQLTLTTPSHQGVWNDFETTLGGVATRDETQGATVSLDMPGAAGSARCARLTNTYAGGTFGATLYAGSVDARKLPRLAFDYRLQPDAMVNLFFRAGDRLCEVRFSGREYPAPGAQMIGAIPDVSADGAWHHVEFDLLGHLERAGFRDQALIVRDLFLANLNDDDYLDAGFGGNHAGTKIWLDNLAIYRPAGAEVVLAAAPAGSVQPSGYAVALSQTPSETPPEQINAPDGKLTLTAPGDGVWYVNVRPKLADGSWGMVHTMPVWVDTSPPKVLGVSPQGPALTSNDPIEIRVSDGTGVGVDPGSIKVKVGDEEYGLTVPGVSYEPDREAILVQPHLLGHVFSGAGKLRLALVALADRNGHALSQPTSWSFDVGPAVDRDPPPPPVLAVGDTPLIRDSFETDMGEWENWGGDGGATLSRDSSTAAEGRYSLKLYNALTGGTFGAYIRKTSFDAGKYRLVRFWYKVPERLRADLIVFVNGDKKSIRFTDTDSSYQRIGEVPNVVADNEWHHAEFDLYSMLRRADPNAPGYKVHQMLIADSGWTSNAPGQVYHLDDFQIVPISSAATPLRIAWAIQDLTGLGGASWVIDNNPETVPPARAMTSQSSAEYRGSDVDGWLHVRASDNGGNWSGVTHQRLLVDSAAPVAAQISPPSGARTAVSEIRLKLSDNGIAGVDPGSVVLSVAGSDYTVSNSGLTYLSNQGELVFNCERTSPRPTVFANGQEIQVALKSAADYAGNRVAQLPAWTWTMDYSKDTTPPVVARVECRTHESVLVQTFETGTEGWGNRGGPAGAKVEHDLTQAGSGKGSIKLTQQQDGGHMQAIISNTRFNAEDYPVIAFDYRLDPKVQLSLMVSMAGRWHAIALTDDAQGALGRINGVRADGKWHYASVNLAPLLRRELRRGPLEVEAIIIGDREPFGTPQGATANFDNFIVGRVGTSKPVFRWQATDTTGIAGYSWVLDQEPATDPPTQNMGDKVAMTFSDLKQGLWFLHLRAVDGAGNWGPTTHYGFMHAGN